MARHCGVEEQEGGGGDDQEDDEEACMQVRMVSFPGYLWKGIIRVNGPASRFWEAWLLRQGRRGREGSPEQSHIAYRVSSPTL
jgi:hypothetical protein